MRAISLATTVVIALAMIATPTLAADRTVQPHDRDFESAALAEWISELQRAWLGFVLPGAGGLVVWTPMIEPVEQETLTEATVEPAATNRRHRVILEDGAPF